MTKQEVMERLCALTSKVAETSKWWHAADCFCGKNNGGSFHTMDEEVINFIEKAVKEACATALVNNNPLGHQSKVDQCQVCGATGCTNCNRSKVEATESDLCPNCDYINCNCRE